MTKQEFKKFLKTYNLGSFILQEISSSEWMFRPINPPLHDYFSFKFFSESFTISKHTNAWYDSREGDEILNNLFEPQIKERLLKLIIKGDINYNTRSEKWGSIMINNGVDTFDLSLSVPKEKGKVSLHFDFITSGTRSSLKQSQCYTDRTFTEQPYDIERFKISVKALNKVLHWETIKENPLFKHFVQLLETIDLTTLNKDFEYVPVSQINTNRKPRYKTDLTDDYEGFADILIAEAKEELLLNDIEGALSKVTPYFDLYSVAKLPHYTEDGMFIHNFITEYLNVPDTRKDLPSMGNGWFTPIKIDQFVIDNFPDIHLYLREPNKAVIVKEGVTDLKNTHICFDEEVIIELPSTLDGDIDLQEFVDIKDYRKVYYRKVYFIIKGNIRIPKWEYDILKDRIWVE